MPAIVRKSTSATNGVACLSQTTNVSDDGLITVRARFLLRNSADAGLFELDSMWPSGSTPRGLPRNQGGPYLASRDFEYATGLTFVTATYVTAANPVRVVYSQQRSTRAFAGVLFVNDPDPSVGVVPVVAKFDYIGTVASARYALMDRQTFKPDLKAARINDVIGVASSIERLILKKNIDSEDRVTLGRVHQVTSTREVVFYTED